MVVLRHRPVAAVPLGNDRAARVAVAPHLRLHGTLSRQVGTVGLDQSAQGVVGVGGLRALRVTDAHQLVEAVVLVAGGGELLALARLVRRLAGAVAVLVITVAGLVRVAFALAGTGATM